MKLLTVAALTLVTSTVWAQVTENTHQHLVFEYASSKPDIQKVNVASRINNQVPGHSANFIQLEPQGRPSLSFDVPQKQFELEKKLANSVFEATTGTGTARGTAFLIGPDLVLTNKHVLASDKAQGCRKFAVDLNHIQETVACEEVLHCSAVHDFCLVKMAPMKNGKDIGEEVQPLKFSFKKPAQTEHSLIIGNAYGVGIQAASYKGVFDGGANWGHFNRAFSGNSGSPLFNQNGEVIGIHYGRGGMSNVTPPADRDVGFAVKAEVMVKELKDYLPDYYAALMGSRTPAGNNAATTNLKKAIQDANGGNKCE